MKLVVLAEKEVFEKFKTHYANAECTLVKTPAQFLQHSNADAFFDLQETAFANEHPTVNKPLFLNSVINTICFNKDAIRINGWPGFIENNSWEISGQITPEAKNVLNFLNKKIIECGNEPGFISARIIAMIINEAYFALEEKVSTESEIDTAMKLGTNYPYGPFEWAHKIGIKNVFALLKKLAEQDSRYQPSTLLQKSAEN